MPPHFQFQMMAQTADTDKEAIQIECLWSMLDVQAKFGHEEDQSFPISIGLNSKGGMDDDKFYEYVQKKYL